jgi:hypothetical protein
MNILPTAFYFLSATLPSKLILLTCLMNQKTILLLVSLLIVFGAINTIRITCLILRAKIAEYSHAQ